MRNQTFRRFTCAISLAVLLLVTLSQVGCVNTLFMVSKVLLDDPKQTSAFELATGVSLADEESSILIHCSAPVLVSDDYETLTTDVEEELVRRMKRRGLKVLDMDTAARVLDDRGGSFDPKLLALEIDDVNYIMHVEIDQFRYMVPSSKNLYQGFASGRIVGFEVRGDGDAPRHTVQVFDQGFKVNYPASHPVPVDQQPKNVFIRKFIDHMADSLGASFYDVRNSELFAL